MRRSTGFKKAIDAYSLRFSAARLCPDLVRRFCPSVPAKKAAEILLSCPLYAQAKAAENDWRGGSSG
jgi:hypothetical protein